MALAAAVAGCAGCAGRAPSPSAPFAPGTAADPREVIIVARDYLFVPPVVDLVPGETVTFQVVNGGLIVHEAIVGDMAVQDAWERAEAEAAMAGGPPGSSPAVSVPPDLVGLRILVASGERRDVTWTVALEAVSVPGGWFIGCHIPGHWGEGMVATVRLVDSAGSPLPRPTSR